MIIVVDDEDAIMIVVDRDPAWMIELAWSVSSLAERGHEREAFVIVVIITREYLHSIVERISDDDSMSIIIDRNAQWSTKLARLRPSLADGEQEREIDRRQEHQSMVVSIDDDDATMMLVDSNALRILELEIS